MPAGDLAIVVFLQDENGEKTVYQSYIKRNITDPPVITGTEPLHSIGFSLYPNPADAQFSIELPQPAKERTGYTLHDMFGKTVAEGEFRAGEQTKTIDTREFAGGMYLFQLQNAGGVVRKKVMVVHQ
jgi:hypothetical protein